MKKIIVEIEANISWVFHRTVSGNWIADCPPLGLTVQSASQAELEEDIKDSIDLLFRDLLRNDELDDFLRANGWRRRSDGLSSEEAGDTSFNVPFHLLRAGGHGSATSLHQ